MPELLASVAGVFLKVRHNCAIKMIKNSNIIINTCLISIFIIKTELFCMIVNRWRLLTENAQ
jgi:hypothetical protein